MSKAKQRPASTGKEGPKVAKNKRASQGKETAPPAFQPNAAGIDIGAREIYVAVPAGRDPHPVVAMPCVGFGSHWWGTWLPARSRSGWAGLDQCWSTCSGPIRS